MGNIHKDANTKAMEINNHPQGRGQAAATPKNSGPAVGNASGNQTEGGGINRRTKGGRRSGKM